MSAAIWHAVPEKTSSRVFLVRHPIPFVILFDRRRLEPMILFQLTGILHLQTATGGRSALCVYEKERKGEIRSLFICASIRALEVYAVSSGWKNSSRLPTRQDQCDLDWLWSGTSKVTTSMKKDGRRAREKEKKLNCESGKKIISNRFIACRHAGWKGEITAQGEKRGSPNVVVGKIAKRPLVANLFLGSLAFGVLGGGAPVLGLKRMI